MHDMPVEVTVNGRSQHGLVEPRVTLADFLREKCGLTGTHLGCEHGACGACTVLLDGQAAMRDCHGLQCGFCTPGFVMSITALLRDNPKPTDEEIREGLSGNFCRCTGYQAIINAAHRAAETLSDAP